jgi:hypothetical protein
MGKKLWRILSKVVASTLLWGSFTCRKARHGTGGFTSPPKEGVLRIFSPEKFDGFGRVWTRELGYQWPAPTPLLLHTVLWYFFHASVEAVWSLERCVWFLLHSYITMHGSKRRKWRGLG